MIGSVIQKGSVIYVYDEKNHQIATRCVPSGGKLQGYTGTTFSVLAGHILYVYDAKCHQLSSRAV